MSIPVPQVRLELPQRDAAGIRALADRVVVELFRVNNWRFRRPGDIRLRVSDPIAPTVRFGNIEVDGGPEVVRIEVIQPIKAVITGSWESGREASMLFTLQTLEYNYSTEHAEWPLEVIDNRPSTGYGGPSPQSVPSLDWERMRRTYEAATATPAEIRAARLQAAAGPPPSPRPTSSSAASGEENSRNFFDGRALRPIQLDPP